MSFLLDTNICSEHLRRPSSLTHRLLMHSGRLAVSSITVAELYTWIFRTQNLPARLTAFNEFLADVHVYPFDEQCAEWFGRVRASLLQQGVTVPALDLLIASTALAHNLTLVTHNVADFQHIPGLRIVDWLQP